MIQKPQVSAQYFQPDKGVLGADGLVLMVPVPLSKKMEVRKYAEKLLSRLSIISERRARIQVSPEVNSKLSEWRLMAVTQLGHQKLEKLVILWVRDAVFSLGIHLFTGGLR